MLFGISAGNEAVLFWIIFARTFVEKKGLEDRDNGTFEGEGRFVSRPG